MTLHPLARRVVVLGAPALLTGLMIYHSQGNFDGAAGLEAFIVLHLAMLPLFALAAWAGWLLLTDVGGPAAWTARLGLGLFVPFYSAYDALLGIGRSLVRVRAEGASGAAATVAHRRHATGTVQPRTNAAAAAS